MIEEDVSLLDKTELLDELETTLLLEVEEDSLETELELLTEEDETMEDSLLEEDEDSSVIEVELKMLELTLSLEDTLIFSLIDSLDMEAETDVS